MRYCNKTIKEWAIAAWRRNIGENLIYKVLRWLEWECRTINLFCVSVESNNTELHKVSLHYERLVQWWVTTGYIHVWWQYHNWSLTFALRKKYDVSQLKSDICIEKKIWCLRLFEKHSPWTGYTTFCEAVSKLCQWPLCISCWHEIQCACWEAAGESEEERVHRPHAGWGSQVMNKTWEKILCFLLQPLSCTCCCETQAGWPPPPPIYIGA